MTAVTKLQLSRLVRIGASVLAAVAVYGTARLHAYAHLDRLPLCPAFSSLASGWRFSVDLSLPVFALLLFALLSVPAHLPSRAARRTFFGVLLGLTLFNILNAFGVAHAVSVLWVHADVSTTIRCQVVSFVALGLLWLTLYPFWRSGALAAPLC